MRTQVDRLGFGTRKRLLLELIKAHGGELMAGQDEDGRVEVMRALLTSLDLISRQSLVRTLARRSDVVGESVGMASGLLQSMSGDETELVLRHQLNHLARRASSPTLGKTREQGAQAVKDLVAASLPAGMLKTSNVGTQVGSGLTAASDKAAQTASSLAGHAARAELLAEVAAEVGTEATAALPAALEAMELEEREAVRRRKRHDEEEDAPRAEEEESRALLPLLRALDKRCAEQRQVETALRAEVARLRGYDVLDDDLEETPR